MRPQRKSVGTDYNQLVCITHLNWYFLFATAIWAVCVCVWLHQFSLLFTNLYASLYMRLPRICCFFVHFQFHAITCNDGFFDCREPTDRFDDHPMHTKSEWVSEWMRQRAGKKNQVIHTRWNWMRSLGSQRTGQKTTKKRYFLFHSLLLGVVFASVFFLYGGLYLTLNRAAA